MSLTFNLNNILDTSGNARHLILSGFTPPAVATNPFSIGQNALTFTNATAFCNGNTYALPSGDYTFEFRVKRVTTTGAQTVFGRWGYDPATTNLLLSYIGYFKSTGEFVYNHCNTGSCSTFASATSTVAIDTNPHVFMICRSGSTIYMYIDGVLNTTATGATASPAMPPDLCPFRVGDLDTPNGDAPLNATIGDFRFSNIARQTGASTYTVPTTPLTADANTLALLRLSSISGNYLSQGVFQSFAVTRTSSNTATGTSNAIGGCAGPDGIRYDPIGNRYFFTYSAYDSSTTTGTWRVYGVWAPSIATLISGGGTHGLTPIQTPGTGDGGFCANGTIFPWQGSLHSGSDKYVHIYPDGSAPANLKIAQGTSLNAANAPGIKLFDGTTADSVGTVYAGGWQDPSVYISDDGSKFVLYCVGQLGSLRYFVTSTCLTNLDPSVPGNWTIPVTRTPPVFWQPDGPTYVGAPWSVPFAGGVQIATNDGATASGQPRSGYRQVCDGTYWYTARKYLGPTASYGNGPGNTTTGGSGPGGLYPYIGGYDVSGYLDAPNKQIIYISADSTNNNSVQPTDSDVQVVTYAINGTFGAFNAAWAYRSSLALGAH